MALDNTFATQGVILFKHIFQLAPGALEMFSFKDEPDLYNSPKLIKHGQNVFKAVDNALSGFSGHKTKLEQLGGRHVTKGV